MENPLDTLAEVEKSLADAASGLEKLQQEGGILKERVKDLNDRRVALEQRLMDWKGDLLEFLLKTMEPGESFISGSYSFEANKNVMFGPKKESIGCAFYMTHTHHPDSKHFVPICLALIKQMGPRATGFNAKIGELQKIFNTPSPSNGKSKK